MDIYTYTHIHTTHIFLTGNIKGVQVIGMEHKLSPLHMCLKLVSVFILGGHLCFPLH